MQGSEVGCLSQEGNFRLLEGASQVKIRTQAMKKEMKHRAEPILFGFALRSYHSGGKARIHIRFGRIGLALLLFVAVGWLATATALYLYFKKGFQLDSAGIGIREHGTDLSWEGVKFTGMLALPFRMDEHRKELGNYYIQRAEESVKEQEYMQALDLLRLGVAKSPGNLRGRRILSEFFDFGFKQHDDAADILVAGIGHGGMDDSEYLAHVFRYLLHHEYDRRIIDTAEKLLGDWKGKEADKTLVVLALANAYAHQYNFGKAHELVAGYGLKDFPEGNILLAEMHWRRGENDKAFALLEETAKRFPYATRVYNVLSNYQEESGDATLALRTIVLAQVNNPESLDLAVLVLRKLYAAGQTERFEESFTDVLEAFGKDLNSNLTIAMALAELGLPSHCQKVLVKARNLGLDDPRFGLAVMTARILGENSEEALLMAGDLAREAGDWKVKHYRSQLSFLQALANYAKGDTDKGKAYLREFLEASEETPPATTIHQFAGYLAKLGFREEARQTLEFGKNRYKDYRPILEDLARQHLEAGFSPELPGSIEDLLQATRKDAKLLLQCRESLASDRYMFTPEQGDLLDSLANTLRKIQAQGALTEGVGI
jgi:tetratricopeptide (TPR) repeat protein